MIYLIGAGPGDPALITVRGLELLRTADVVLYDRLAPPELLLETRHGCEFVDVGKRSGAHSKTQNEITDLLIEYGRKDISVVRLKGGDPFLFGRGAEECGYLAVNGIPYEVIPGVSALNAATASAGIPITHRDHASSFGVATGHGAEEKGDDPVDWKALGQGVDTVIVFMGVGNLNTITQELAAGGLPTDTPAALIERGCTPLQRTVAATLGTIADEAVRKNVKPPSLLIVGKTVPLAESLQWYKPGPLAGLTIGVTRPFSQSRSFAEKLRNIGARPIFMPTIKTEMTIDTPDVQSVMDRLSSFNAVAFSSSNGVDAFFQALHARGLDSRSLAGKSITSIGPATADALKRQGIAADIVAETFVAEGLLDAILSAGSVTGKSFLLVRSNIGRNTLADGLRSAGAVIEQAAFYATREAELRGQVIEMITGGEIDMVTFTSSSTVDGLFNQVPVDVLSKKVKFASIGPQTSKRLRKYGIEPDIEASVYTTDGLTNAILDTPRKK